MVIGRRQLLDGGTGGKGGKGDDICGNSFAGETRVLLGDGRSERIDRVRVGDRVWAADPETGERAIRRVTDVIVGDGWKRLTKLTLATAVGLAAIVATAGHPLWSESDGAWVAAAEVEAGDLLEGPDGHDVAVVAVAQDETVRRVYNLTVEGLHTFFVVAGDEGVLVHNISRMDASCILGGDEAVSWVDDHLLSQGSELLGHGIPVKSPWGSTDIDVLARDPSGALLLIEVGGKGETAAKMGTKFKHYLWQAEQYRGAGNPNVRVQMYYVSSTPSDVVDYLKRILGPENVVPIS